MCVCVHAHIFINELLNVCVCVNEYLHDNMDGRIYICVICV